MAAVYIDSGHDLAAVWAVYTKLFPNLEAVIANPVSTISSKQARFHVSLSSREAWSGNCTRSSRLQRARGRGWEARWWWSCTWRRAEPHIGGSDTTTDWRSSLLAGQLSNSKGLATLSTSVKVRKSCPGGALLDIRKC